MRDWGGGGATSQSTISVMTWAPRGPPLPAHLPRLMACAPSDTAFTHDQHLCFRYQPCASACRMVRWLLAGSLRHKGEPTATNTLWLKDPSQLEGRPLWAAQSMAVIFLRHAHCH